MNEFITQFKKNIKFEYSCFDRVIIKGYIQKLFWTGKVFILLLLFSCWCAGQTLKIDSDAALRYIDLISYMRFKNNVFFTGQNFSEKQIEQKIAANINDEKLTKKINALLFLPVYDKLKKAGYSFYYKVKGREAYKLAFYYSPWKRTKLRGPNKFSKFL